LDLNKIFIKNATPTKVGGQAVMEGVMMKGSSSMATSIRLPDGSITTDMQKNKKPGAIAKIPLLRGIYALIQSMVTGTRTLMYSAEVLEEAGAQVEKDKFDLWIEKKFGDKANTVILYFSVIVALVFSVGFFIILPTLLTNAMGAVTQNPLWLNLFEGILRILLFVIYILIISRLKDIRRVFQYHGAEHKSIHCYENGLDLTVENCRSFPTLHPRCGTSFLMFVMVISLLLYSFLGWPSWIVRIASRIIFIPLVAGISYELLKFAGKSSSSFIKFISIPGLLLQKLTTVEPDDDQLEVALTSLKAVLGEDANE
jgi:uncharacterized protein YqhQ